MTRRDAEIQALEEWLQQLGYPTQLQPEEIRQLLAPNLRSVWRHLKTFVKPVQSVETIRKNLLLAKLRKENIKPNQRGNFIIQSLDELTLVKRVSDFQKEINSQIVARKSVDEEIKFLIHKNAKAKYDIISKKNTIKEMEDKITLMNLKLTQVNKYINELDEEHFKAKILETFQISESNTENNSNNVSSIATHLLNNMSTPIESQCDEDKKLLLSLSKDYSVKAIYKAFILASDIVYNDLKQFTANLDMHDENLESNSDVSFSNHIKHLNALIIKNQLGIADIIQKVSNASDILDKEKSELVNLIKERVTITNDNFFQNQNIQAEEFVEKLVNKSELSTKSVTLQKIIGELEAECFEHDDLKQLVAKSKDENNELQSNVVMKVNYINGLYSEIYGYNSKVDEVRTEIIQICNKYVSNFLNEIRSQKDLNTVILHSEPMIVDEIKMFHDIPLCALTRRWEDVCELLPRELLDELSSDPELRLLLLQSEPKNILCSVLEKKWWSSCLIDNY